MSTPMPGSPRLAPGHRRNRFFAWIAVAMLAAIALGFGPTFYLRPLTDRPPLPANVVLHGVVLTAWYLLLLAQALLVARGRVELHRKLGMAGIVLAAAVFASGVQVNLALVGRVPPEMREMAIGFATMGIGGLLAFVPLMALAVVFRRRPAVHKRLVFWAFVITIGPAFAPSRPFGAFLDSLVAPALPFFPSDLVWFAALLAYDWRTLHRIHPVTWVGFLVLALYLVVVVEAMAAHPAVRGWVAAWS